jgi:hypothetical protein
VRVQFSPAASKALAECLTALCHEVRLIQGGTLLARVRIGEEGEGLADGFPDTAQVYGRDGLVMVLDVGGPGSDAALVLAPHEVVKGGPVRLGTFEVKW